MARRVTITDVAREAGVSVATVSKVINGRDGIARTTAAHVQEVVGRLGYEQSIVARSMRSHRTHVIGVLVAEFEPFSTQILTGAGAALEGTGYALLAYTGGGPAAVGWERRYLARLSGTLVDGAVLVTPTIEGVDDEVPVVAVDPHAGPGAMPTVDSENHEGAVLATRHLLDLGHTRIGFLGGRPDLESSRAREAGYRAALAAAGLHPDPAHVRSGEYRRADAVEPARAMLSTPHPPTAVFAANDQSALGILDAAAALGVRVPHDLSVVGFDDIPEAAAATPPLTTVRQELQEMGARAVRLLLGVLADPEATAEPEHVRLPTTLVVRASTAPPPA
ncbi:LacI family DNA-binding transcriptional regulator [Cellulomonas triticagri]|uniref:LacI family transcriptional regulator n=1 Tax=Cellulomonas triticagri TaxID=2483352 RepID=A0A3M2J668_9CELL|nr:LacI family DNA-binding transcriptional regulator [Cellulomonas triticagri]RMI09602.1 LacI family transcriptional regulator [Cellulomonas triticagri]